MSAKATAKAPRPPGKAQKSASPALAVSDRLCFAIYSAGHAFNRVYKPLLDELGLTYPQYLVMLSLWTEDGQTVGEIGRTLLLESSTLTPLLKRLEALGLVSRKRDPKDERQVRLRLTDKGNALRRKSSHVSACIGAASGLELKAMIELRDQITALRDSLDKAAAA